LSSGWFAEPVAFVGDKIIRMETNEPVEIRLRPGCGDKSVTDVAQIGTPCYLGSMMITCARCGHSGAPARRPRPGARLRCTGCNACQLFECTTPRPAPRRGAAKAVTSPITSIEASPPFDDPLDGLFA
jgi:hypothetical protein